MKTLCVLMVVFMIQINCYSFFDEYEDGDYSNDPTWILANPVGTDSILQDPIRANNKVLGMYGTSSAHRSVVSNTTVPFGDFYFEVEFMASSTSFSPIFSLRMAGGDCLRARIQPEGQNTKWMIAYNAFNGPDWLIRDPNPPIFSGQPNLEWWKMTMSFDKDLSQINASIYKVSDSTLVYSRIYPIPMGFENNVITQVGLEAAELDWQYFDKIRLTSEPNKYSGGSGTEADPYQISTVADWQELMNTSADWNKSFILTADLDLAGVSLNPVGTEGNPFVGVVNGNDHIIHNVVLNQPSNAFVGLFGQIGSGGQLKNLGVVNVDIQGLNRVGGLCGSISGGKISECYTSGKVMGEGDVGGLSGTNVNDDNNNVSTITNCYSDCTVSGHGGVGGLCGENINSTITSCYATGSVTGTGSTVGGLCGLNLGTITHCYATNPVTGQGWVGGMCGSTVGPISECYATGSVTGGYIVGGLCGSNGWGPITGCFSTGPVTATGSPVGGLCGFNNQGTISHCYATGSVMGSQSIGGLCGENLGGTISECYAAGMITGSDINVGGICGSNSGTISLCFWDTQTSDQPTSAGGTGKTTAEMKTLSTFIDAGWDFVGETVNGTADIWRMPTEGYPILSWQSFVEPGVYFADANLKAAVEEKLGVTNPTAEDMLKLTYLDARTRGITSLVGLETAVNLTTLYLNQNAVSDIEPLAGLTKLTVLNLYLNKIADISPLAGLTNLYVLACSANQVTELSPLSGLPNLMYLYINNNPISDFSAITGQTKLKEIYATRTAVLTKETYLTHIPAIRANNPKLAVFQYDPGCQTLRQADANDDCRVNLLDLAVIAADWLTCNHIYEEMCP